ncbi:T-lymphocyte surface antigen Ly-9-like [Protopterus annectens]|uniref:T-lymphocyte surface antigen Ly-9-like n=1 Tax=Protopterus annectens TaxID=7888 RepID=UPI001CFC3559|nr:T-lymphocyte surface antigen Ly-9-like [Protopterus annectens]
MVSFLNYISVKFQKTNVTTAMVYFFSLRDAFFLLFFTVEISISGTAEVQTLYAPLNESVTIEWKIKEQETQHEKEWTWTKTVGGTSITLAKIDDQGKDKYPFAQQFKGRLKMHPNGSLTISGLLYIDSGRYQQAMILIEKEQQSHFLDLIIIKKITKIKISPISNSTSNNICNLTLRCIAEDGSNVTYLWRVPKNNPSFYSGANLHVNVPVTDEGTLISCKASNPINSKMNQFNTTEICGLPNNGNSDIWDMIRLIVGGCICLFAFTGIIICETCI